MSYETPPAPDLHERKRRGAQAINEDEESTRPFLFYANDDLPSSYKSFGVEAANERSTEAAAFSPLLEPTFDGLTVPRARRYKAYLPNFAVVITMLWNLTSMLSISALYAILPLVLKNQFGVPDHKGEIIMYVQMFLYSITAIVGGWLTDYYLGTFRSLLYLTTLWTVACVAMAVILLPALELPLTTAWLLAIFIMTMSIASLAYGMQVPIGWVLLGEQYEVPEEAPFDWYYFYTNLGFIVAVLADPFIRQEISAFWAMTIAAAFGLVATLLLVLGKRRFHGDSMIAAAKRLKAAIVVSEVEEEGSNSEIRMSTQDDLKGGATQFASHAQRQHPPNEETASVVKLVDTATSSNASSDVNDKCNAGQLYQEEIEQGHNLASQTEVQLSDAQRLWAVVKILAIFIPYSGLTQQIYVTWTYQAEKMRRTFLFFDIPADSMSTANGVMVMAIIPVLLSFFCAGVVELFLRNGRISIWWQLPQYFFISTAQVLVDVTGTQFTFTQSPEKWRNVLMALWEITAGLGSVLVVGIALLPMSNMLTCFVYSAMMLCITAFYLLSIRNYPYTIPE
ncbi:MFS domain-containing protein, variant 2 [Balamuthia mandrillaris]